MSTRVSQVSNTAKINALKSKHAAVKTMLEEARKSPSTADYYLNQLKKQKLTLKDEITQLSRRAAN